MHLTFSYTVFKEKSPLEVDVINKFQDINDKVLEQDLEIKLLKSQIEEMEENLKVNFTKNICLFHSLYLIEHLFFSS